MGLPLTGNNFNYDRNGNLVYDKSEGIDKIVWNVYGKVTKVDRTAGHAKPDLEFYYDASGRRVMKIVKPNGGSGAKNTWKYVVFSYDAGGQLMAEYETAYKSGTYGLVNTGNYVYGSKRLGKTREKIPLGPMVNYTEIQNCTACATAPVVPGNTAPENIYARTAGNKQYEFANHLGNVLVTVSDRHLQTDDGSYSYLGGTLTQTGTVPDGLLDYYMPQVLTANDYYPGGMPMPGRICSTQTTVVTAVLRDDPFNSGTASYTGTNGATLSNSSGTLLVTKLSSATDSWGARTPAHTLTAGVEYRLSYLLTLGACSAGRETRGWRVVDAAGNDIAGNIVLGTGPFNVNGTFTVPATGTYYIEFYRNTSSTGTCSFTIDNVLLISNTYLTVKVCGTPAEQYAWGHNGQYKDDEIYGPGNTYTAEYWEYDSRLIRRWNTDPIAYDWQSPYACFNNNPIFYADPSGLKGEKGEKGKEKKEGYGDNSAEYEGQSTAEKIERFSDEFLNGNKQGKGGLRNGFLKAADGLKEILSDPLGAGQKMVSHRLKQAADGQFVQILWETSGTNLIYKIGYEKPAQVAIGVFNGDGAGAGEAYGEHLFNGTLEITTLGAGQFAKAMKNALESRIPNLINELPSPLQELHVEHPKVVWDQGIGVQGATTEEAVRSIFYPNTVNMNVVVKPNYPTIDLSTYPKVDLAVSIKSTQAMRANIGYFKNHLAKLAEVGYKVKTLHIAVPVGYKNIAELQYLIEFARDRYRIKVVISEH